MTSGSPPGTPSVDRRDALVIAGLVALYVAFSLCFVQLGNLNEDEGWYLYAGHLVYEGAIPYRDFPFFQAPLAPYFFGLPQALFGGSVLLGRITCLALSLVVFGLGIRLSYERGGRLGAVLFGGGMLLTPFAVRSLTITRTEPLNAALLMISAFLLLRRSPGHAAPAGALCAAVLAAATRAASVPAAAVVLLWVVIRARQERKSVAVTIAPALALAVLVSIPILLDPRAAWVNVVEVQALRHQQLQPVEPMQTLALLARKSRQLAALHGTFGILPTLGVLAIGLLLPSLWSTSQDSERRRFRRELVGLAAIGVAAYAPNLVPQFIHPEYFVAIVPIGFVLVAAFAGHLHAQATGTVRLGVAWGVAGVLALQAITLAGQIPTLVQPDAPDLRGLKEVAAYLDGMIPAAARVATLDTYVAVESRRHVPRGWEMSLFSFFPRRPEEDSRRFHFLTPQRLRESLGDASVRAAVLSDRALGVLVARRESGYRPYQMLNEAQLQAALPPLRRFRLARVFEQFGQFNDNLYVMLAAE